MALPSEVKGEEIYPIEIGSGMYTSELSSSIPDGFSPVCYNLVATGDSLENRIGIRKSSLIWKVLEIAPGGKTALPGTTDTFPDDMNILTPIDPWSKDSSKVAFAWAGRGLAVPGAGLNVPTLNLVRAAGTPDANDGFISSILTSACLGICQYGGTIYYSLWGAGVRKITNINWATDTITSSAIASTGVGSLRGLFVFKDRMWGWGTGVSEHFLYYTDVATAGGAPETWNFASNRIPFVGPKGHGKILSIIPLGNKLVVFTSSGLFTLLVEGAPASWILRVLDSQSICTTRQCAFESKGIVYYVNTEGVWATNALSIKKLSGTIEDQWFLAKGSRSHSIASYEDGMIVSVAKLSALDDRYFDKDNCRVFYTKLDPIAWTEWNINRNIPSEFDEPLPENYAMIWSTTPKIPTYLNNDPTVYTFVHVTDSTEAVPHYSVGQLLIMDGGVDQWTDRTNLDQFFPVLMFLKTKHFDGGNPYRMKQSKYGILELYTSEIVHTFFTSWDIDHTIDIASEIYKLTFNDFAVGNASNYIKVPGMFYFRRAAFNFRALLSSDETQIKLKNVAMAQAIIAEPAEQVQ